MSLNDSCLRQSTPLPIDDDALTHKTDLLTVAEAAELLGITPGAVRMMVSRNRLHPAVWAGDDGKHGHLFTRAEINHYLATYSRNRQRQCPHCHGDVPLGHGSKTYCSVHCRQQAYRREIVGLAPDAPVEGRFIRLPADCDWCGAEFQANGQRHRFCSTSCRVRSFMADHNFSQSAYTKGQVRAKSTEAKHDPA